MKKNFLPFEEARKYVRTLGLAGKKEWNEYKNSKDFLNNLPKNPEIVYKKEWDGTADWLGTGRIKPITKKSGMYSFVKAREYVRSVGLKNTKEWFDYCKSGKKPPGIPVAPYGAYQDDWIGFPDWLGTKRTRATNILSFKEARDFVHTLKLQSKAEWNEYRKTDKIPLNIPKSPEGVYKDEFKGFLDWIGQERGRKFLSYEEAGKKLKSLGVTSYYKFLKFSKDHKRPSNIPSDPAQTYKKEWKGWGDFLKSGNLAPTDYNFRPFEDARNFVASLGLKTSHDWRKYCKSGS